MKKFCLRILTLCWRLSPKAFRSWLARNIGFGKSSKATLLLGANSNPLYDQWHDLGLVIHRYYLERFLEEFFVDIQGHCLEFQEDSYTSRFGGNRVKKIDILHKEEGNPRATIIADLTQKNVISSNAFDCVICTNTLHLVYDFRKMVSELYRILKPKGLFVNSCS